MDLKNSKKDLLKKRTESLNMNQSRLMIRPVHNKTPEPISNTKKSHSRESSIVSKKSSAIKSVPGYSFSKNSRFDSDIFEKFKSKINIDLAPIFKKNLAKIRKSAETINKSKIKIATPKEKLENIKKFSDHERIKEKVSKIARSNIFNEMKTIKEKKLSEKFAKYYLRKNHKVRST